MPYQQTKKSPPNLPRFRVPIKFHKKNLAEMQFSYSIPQVSSEGGNESIKAGAVYLEMAKPFPGGDGDKMDWGQKLVFKLSAQDVSFIITMARKNIFPIRRIHNHHGSKANLTIEKGKKIETGDEAGMMSYSWSLNRDGNWAKIYITDANIHHIFNCLERIQPHLLGWGWLDVMEQMSHIIDRGNNHQNTTRQPSTRREEVPYHDDYDPMLSRRAENSQPLPRGNNPARPHPETRNQNNQSRTNYPPPIQSYQGPRG